MAFGFGGGRIAVVALRGVAQTQKADTLVSIGFFYIW